MKKESSAFSILIETMFEIVNNRENEEELKVIVNFMRISKLSIGELNQFNKATEKNPSLIKKLKDVMKEAERSSY